MICWQRPRVFGVEIGFNMPAFVIALVITAILAIGIKESARFNATIVVIKVAVVLFVIGLGFHYVSASNWGGDWHTFAPYGFSGIGAGAAYIFFAYIGFRRRFIPPRRKPKIRSAICPSGLLLR